MHNDDHNTFAVVHYLLRKVCGYDEETARDQTRTIHENGNTVAGTYDRRTAEAVTLGLVRAGLRVRFRRVR